MLDRILNSKMFISFLLASGTWFVLSFRYPFPADNLVLGYISVKDPLVYGGIRWTYTVMMFTTPLSSSSFRHSPKLCTSDSLESSTNTSPTPSVLIWLAMEVLLLWK
jgi:hypothetical protein